MEDKKKERRYTRVALQLENLLLKTNDPLARMASVCAVLHHKMDHFFWTGFYLLKEDRLIVGPYQGPVACQELEKDRGVCWAALKGNKTVVVKEVSQFPGHIACDSRSRSEIAIPVTGSNGKERAVFDVDSDRPESFNEIDKIMLERIVRLIYA